MAAALIDGSVLQASVEEHEAVNESSLLCCAGQRFH